MPTDLDPDDGQEDLAEDRAIDAQVRAAMAALDRERPVEGLAALAERTLARLDDPGIAALAEPPGLGLAEPGEPGAPTADDSGLHDIRALASETKARLSSRRSARATQELAGGDPFDSSSMSWGAVAMPEPARVVALPSVVRDAAADAQPAVAGAAEPVRPRSRRVRPIAGVGIGLAVAAGVVIVVSSRPERRPPMIAAAPAREAPVTSEAMSAAPTDPHVVGEAAGSGAGADDDRAFTPAPTSVKPSAPRPKSAPPGKAKKSAPALIDGDAATKPEPAAPPPAAADPTPAEPSLDTLMREAGVPPTPPPRKAKLDRAELSAADIKRGMTAVEPRARACFAGTQGTAQLQLAVAPSGRVERVTVSGPFAGTPVGDCVVRAASAAVFPAWDGAAQSFRYNFLLAD
jgi:hypothetical protein